MAGINVQGRAAEPSEGGGGASPAPSPGKTTAVERIFRHGNGAAAAPGPAVEALSGAGGAPLPEAAQARFETSLGSDLSDVRVHTGAGSAAAASELGARAFTTGRDIHFGENEFRP